MSLAGVPNDYLLDGPRPITEGWKSLKAAGFDFVTMIVPNAQSPYLGCVMKLISCAGD